MKKKDKVISKTGVDPNPTKDVKIRPSIQEEAEPPRRLESPLAESHYWGDDYCDLAGYIKEFVELGLKPEQMPTYNGPVLETILHHIKACLFKRDYENFHKIARLFERAVVDRPERGGISRRAYAYEEAIALSGKNPPLKRHVREALQKKHPYKTEKQVNDTLKEFEAETGFKFSNPIVKNKGGRPRKGSGLYEIAEKRLKNLRGSEKRKVEYLIRLKELSDEKQETEARARQTGELIRQLKSVKDLNPVLRTFLNS